MDVKQLGAIIQKRRNVLGITVRELSELTDLSITTISQLENGARNPTLEVLLNIFEFLNLEMKVEVKR